MSLKGTTRDIKWEKDLCFCVGEKIYGVQGIEAEMTGMSFKATPEEFDHLISRPGIIPAPYLARYQWVLVEDLDSLTKGEWQTYLRTSYDMVLSKLSLKKQREILES